MFAEKVIKIANLLHARLCYQLFIMPLHIPVEEEYEFFATMACQYLKDNRTDIITEQLPRHYVIHHFAQSSNKSAKKILITHGWMSRAAYMMRSIRALHQAGFEVYALDFPAHGESKGYSLSWVDAATIIKDILNRHGAFYAVIGHSFGGSMLMVTLTLSSRWLRWKIHHFPPKMILLASPTNPRTPLKKLAKRLRLNAAGLTYFKGMIEAKMKPALHHLNYLRLLRTSKTLILCIHGTDDKTVLPVESIRFCQENPTAELVLLPEVDHVDILINEKAEKRILQFLKDEEKH